MNLSDDNDYSHSYADTSLKEFFFDLVDIFRGACCGALGTLTTIGFVSVAGIENANPVNTMGVLGFGAIIGLVVAGLLNHVPVLFKPKYYHQGQLVQYFGNAVGVAAGIFFAMKMGGDTFDTAAIGDAVSGLFQEMPSRNFA